MRAGIFQCEGGDLTPDRRLQRLADALAGDTLDLVVCPELFLSGYNVGDALPEMAQDLHGRFAKNIRELARSTGTAVVYGYPERDGQILYNSAACISADGALIANHRKLLLPPGFESEYFSSGQGTSLFELNGFLCGIVICYDAEFPETARALANAGAQVMIVPTALTSQWGVVAHKVMPSRAFENGLWLIYANHAGVENGMHYLGESCIVAPDGQDKARAGEAETLLSCELDAQSVLAARKKLPYLTQLEELSRRLSA
jgi:predicted amidohydrolase